MAIPAAIALALALAGCAGPSSSATPTPSAGADCPGTGTCLGPLVAGTHTSGSFQPALTYTVPDGWVNDEDLPGSFNLRRAADGVGGAAVWANHVGVHRDLRVPAARCEEPDPDVGPSVEEIVGWLTSHPGLVATTAEEVSLGGLDGQALDVGLAETWTEVCPWEGNMPMVAILTGSGLNQLGRVVVGDLRVRLYLLATPDGTVTIKVTDVPGGETFEHYLAEVEPIIETFSFGDVGWQEPIRPATRTAHGTKMALVEREQVAHAVPGR